jgi:LytS/YehU family sensor histidine kinase
MRVFNHLSTLILVTGFSLGLGVLDRLRHNEKEKKEMEKEMLNAELALLKNQVSPHFFFNTLNNIYSLIQFDTQKAGETVHKLSKLMRYLLYDSDQDLVDLTDEIQFMQNYIELMHLRLNDKVRLTVDLPVKSPSIKVPPLLFIPVVENAFKHGVSYSGNSFIEIGMLVDGHEVAFRTRNSLAGEAAEKRGDHSGIGLENVRKRLDLLFPRKHVFQIIPGRDAFQVDITVNTKDLQS